MEISLDAWVGVQRHVQDLADRLAQGFSGHLHLQVPQPPQLGLLPWSPALPHKLVLFDIDVPFVGGAVDLPAVAVASFVEIGERLAGLGQAGSELGASVGTAAQQLARQIPVPFRAKEGARRRKREAAPPPPPAAVDEGEVGLALERAAESGLALERAGGRGPLEVAAAAAAAATGIDAAATASGVGTGDADELDEEEDEFECEIGTLGKFKKAKGTVNVLAAYSTRHHTIDGSVVARGDIWRLESS